jgi:hypothetical protein
VEFALAYLERVAPAVGAEHRTRLAPLVERLAAFRYPTFARAQHDTLRRALQSLERALRADSARRARATSPREYALALRNAWGRSGSSSRSPRQGQRGRARSRRFASGTR